MAGKPGGLEARRPGSRPSINALSSFSFQASQTPAFSPVSYFEIDTTKRVEADITKKVNP